MPQREKEREREQREKLRQVEFILHTDNWKTLKKAGQEGVVEKNKSQVTSLAGKIEFYCATVKSIFALS